MKKSLDYNFNSETENKYNQDVTKNTILKSEIKEDILEIIGEVEDDQDSEPKETKDKKTKEMEDKLSKLIKEQNKTKSSSSNSDLIRQISELKGQLRVAEKITMPRSTQQTVKPGQLPVKSGVQQQYCKTWATTCKTRTTTCKTWTTWISTTSCTR